MPAAHAGDHGQQHAAQKAHRQGVQGQQRRDVHALSAHPHGEGVQAEGHTQPDKTQVKHRQQTVAQAAPQPPAHGQGQDQHTRDQGRAKAHPPQPGRRGQATRLQPHPGPLHKDHAQQGPQQPVGAPGIQTGHGRGRKERDHAVSHHHIHRHDEAPQAQQHRRAHHGVSLGGQAHRGRHHRQQADQACRGNQAGVQTIRGRAALDHAHKAPRQHRPTQGDQRHARRGQGVMHISSHQHRGPACHHGQHTGQDLSRTHLRRAQPFGAGREQETREEQGHEAQTHQQRVHKGLRHGHAHVRGPGAAAQHHQPPPQRRHRHHSHGTGKRQPVRGMQQQSPTPCGRLQLGLCAGLRRRHRGRRRRRDLGRLWLERDDGASWLVSGHGAWCDAPQTANEAVPRRPACS